MRDIKLWLDFGVLLLVGWLICTIVTAPVSAADLLLGQRTYHFAPTANWDECKDGSVACREPFNDSQELIGLANDKWAVLYMHQNSVRERSFVVARTFKTDWGRYVRPYAAVGAATGYASLYDQWSVGDVTPMGYFGVDLHPSHDKYGVLITWQPTCFIGAGLRIRL